MGRVGVSTVKSFSFRGVAQEFSNTYYYTTPLGVTEGTAEALIDAIVTKEKAMHSNSVSFLRGLCWTAGGTNAENQMLKQKNLSGTGSNGTPGSSTDKERAFLVRFRAGQDSRGNPVYLRKWWHLDASAIASTAISAGALQNTAQLTTTQRDQLKTWADDFKNITAGVQQFELVSEKGRQISGDTVAHPYYEHRQLGDAWRG